MEENNTPPPETHVDVVPTMEEIEVIKMLRSGALKLVSADEGRPSIVDHIRTYAIALCGRQPTALNVGSLVEDIVTDAGKPDFVADYSDSDTICISSDTLAAIARRRISTALQTIGLAVAEVERSPANETHAPQTREGAP